MTNHSNPCLKLCLRASSYHQYDAPKAIPKDLSYSHTKSIECIVWFCPDFLPAVPNDYRVMRLKCAGCTRCFLYISPNFALHCLPCETPGGKLFSSFPPKPRKTHQIFSLGNCDSWVIGGLCTHSLRIPSFQGLIIVVGLEEERVDFHMYKL